jgi:hypothetical protein
MQVSKRKAVILVALTMLGNCLGNLSSDVVRSSYRTASKVWVRAHQQNNQRFLAKEKLEHFASHS